MVTVAADVVDAIKVGSGKVDVALLAEEGLVEEGGDGVVVAAGQSFNHDPAATWAKNS
jgi:hypothetical protein